MKVTQKKLEGDMLRLEATATVAEVDQAFQAAQIAFAQQMNLRPQGGETIAQAAEETLGIKDLDPVVEPQAAEYLVPFAFDKKNIVPAYPPHVEAKSPLKRGAEYAFALDFEKKPEYELSSYDKVSFSIEPLELNEREVDNQIAQMAESYADYVGADPHPVEKGDHVLLAIEATRNGEPMAGLTTDARTYTTGGGFMPDGFDENVIGMDVGETKSFTFTAPSLDDTGGEAEETIACTVTVKEIQKRVIPAITDAWVKENMPMVTGLDGLKGMIREELMRSHKEEYERYKRQLASSELAKRFQGKIADPVYEAMQSNIVSNLQMQLQRQNISLEKFIEENGGQQQFSMMMMMQTRQNLIEGYSLDALFRHEKMALSEDDIFEACRAMSPQQPQMVREQMEKAGCGFILRESASRMKANRWLVENADITVAKAGSPEGA